MSARRTITALAVSAAAATAVRRLPEPKVQGWIRSNYRDRPVSLSGGLSAAAGTLAAAAISPPLAAPAVVAGLSAMLAGGYDDLLAGRAEHRSDKGLRGHLRALRAGRASGGVVKVALIGAGSVAAARLLPDRSSRSRRFATRWPATLADAALIAGTANLLNLFDLRPGRATKIALAISGAGLAGANPGPLAAVAGAGVATLRADLGELTMLGDLGANTLGAVIGVRLAAASLPTRITAGAVIAALTVASERVSFTRVIASTPPLRWLDELGRARVSPPPQR